jgi:hypothetical protein
MKIRPMGAELFQADRQTDLHDEANSRNSQFCKRAKQCCSNVITNQCSVRELIVGACK